MCSDDRDATAICCEDKSRPIWRPLKSIQVAKLRFDESPAAAAICVHDPEPVAVVAHAFEVRDLCSVRRERCSIEAAPLRAGRLAAAEDLRGPAGGVNDRDR